MANPLARIFSGFTSIASLFARGGDGVVGVDFGSSAVKVVQLKKRNGQAVLETYGSVALGPYAGVEAGRATRLTASQLSEAFTDVLREAKITASAYGCAVPFASSLVEVMTLPPARGENEDLASLVRIEARKYVPTPLSEVEFDWQILPPVGGADTGARPASRDALIIATHRDAFARLQAVFAAARRAASFFEVEIWSTLRALAVAPDAAVGVVDIGASAAKIFIVDTGLVRGAHIVNRGGQDITLSLAESRGISVAEAEAEKRAGALSVEKSPPAGLARIFAEAREVFAHYERRAGRALSGAVLSGGGALLSGTLAVAEESLDISATLADPFSRFEAPAFLAPLLSSVGPEFAVAAGAALRMMENTR